MRNDSCRRTRYGARLQGGETSHSMCRAPTVRKQRRLLEDIADVAIRHRDVDTAVGRRDTRRSRCVGIRMVSPARQRSSVVFRSESRTACDAGRISATSR